LSYVCFIGGILGVVFLTGNLLLLPRLGASLTVVMTVAGQIIMGVTIDTFGWFGADVEPFTIFKVLGILFLILGIILMNYVRRNPKDKNMNSKVYIWLIIGFSNTNSYQQCFRPTSAFIYISIINLIYNWNNNIIYFNNDFQQNT